MVVVRFAAEALAVAGQVISAGYLATGQRAARARARKRLGKATVTIGLITAAALAAAAGPISYAFFPTDTAAAKSTKTIFRWAALSVPLVWPNALCEAVLLGAGRYRYLAGATLVNALVASFATVALLSARPLVTSAWACCAASSCCGCRLRGRGRAGPRNREGRGRRGVVVVVSL